MALTTSLISFWELGEATGTTRNDSTASANHLTDHNAVALNSGAAEFTAASSQFLSCADNTSLSVGSIDFTCAGWVYFTGTAAQSGFFIGQYNGSSSNDRSWVLFQYTDSTMNFVVSSAGLGGESGSQITGPTLSANTWYFFLCGHDEVNQQIFLQINNGTYNTLPWTAGVYDSFAPFTLGCVYADSVTVNFLTGRLDQVGFWKRTLTVDEKTWLYNGGTRRSYAEIVAESATTTLMGVILM